MNSKILLVLGLLLPGCKRTDPGLTLPAATQVGANTAGCLIDGQPFVATGWKTGLLSSPIPALYGGCSFDSLYTMELNGVVQGRNTTITLFLRTQQPGTYRLNQHTPYYPQGSPRTVLNHATYSVAANQAETYVTDANHTGWVTLTCASSQTGISAGTFEFTAASQLNASRTVTVTSGRFDCKQ